MNNVKLTYSAKWIQIWSHPVVDTNRVIINVINRLGVLKNRCQFKIADLTYVSHEIGRVLTPSELPI